MLLPILPRASFESNDLDFLSDDFESIASSLESAFLLFENSFNEPFTKEFSSFTISFT